MREQMEMVEGVIESGLLLNGKLARKLDAAGKMAGGIPGIGDARSRKMEARRSGEAVAVTQRTMAGLRLS